MEKENGNEEMDRYWYGVIIMVSGNRAVRFGKRGRNPNRSRQKCAP